MDVNDLYTSSGDRNRPRWLHILHPRKGHPMYAGEGLIEGELPEGADPADYEPIMALVYSDESDVAIDAADAHMVAAKTELLEQIREDPDFNVLQMDTERAKMRAETNLAIAVTESFRGLKIGAEPLTGSTEHKKIFFNRDFNYVRQVMAFARSPTAFFGDGLDDSATSQPSSGGDKADQETRDDSPPQETPRDSSDGNSSGSE